MKKTYWWRVAALITAGLLCSLIDQYSFSFFGYGIWENYMNMVGVHFLVVLLVFPVLLFSSDMIFFRWIWFAVTWIVIVSFIVALMIFGRLNNSVVESFSEAIYWFFFFVSFLLIEYWLWKERAKSPRRFYWLSSLIIVIITLSLLMVYSLRTSHFVGI